MFLSWMMTAVCCSYAAATMGFGLCPGGCQNLSETPAECARRECLEETGFTVRLVKLLGIFSSIRYEYVHYPWKDNEFCHLLFHGVITNGRLRLSDESLDAAFFPSEALPPFSDGHQLRVEYAFRAISDPAQPPFFE